VSKILSPFDFGEKKVFKNVNEGTREKWLEEHRGCELHRFKTNVGERVFRLYNCEAHNATFVEEEHRFVI